MLNQEHKRQGRRVGALRLALPLMMVVAACGDGGAPPVDGAMEQATFAPECGSFNQACLRAGLDAPIATGAQVPIHINFQIQGSSGPPISLATVRPDVLDVDAATVFANQEGSTSLLVFGPDDTVLDFIHVWVSDPDELRLVRRGDEGQVLGDLTQATQRLPGDELRVSVEPYRASQPLLGLFEPTWTVTGDAVSIVRDGVAGWYRVVARQPGDATLKADAHGLSLTLSVEVLP